MLAVGEADEVQPEKQLIHDENGTLLSLDQPLKVIFEFIYF